jgi:hypothetical protein
VHPAEVTLDTPIRLDIRTPTSASTEPAGKGFSEAYTDILHTDGIQRHPAGLIGVGIGVDKGYLRKIP